MPGGMPESSPALCPSGGSRRWSPTRLMIFCSGALGVIIGGRLGYVLFYNPAYYLSNPLEIPAVWQGGMSFHGGFLGVVLAIYLYARFKGTEFLH